jgi:hypothetical protein
MSVLRGLRGAGLRGTRLAGIPACMSPAPSAPRPSEPVRAGGGAGEDPSPTHDQHERFGPLQLTRVHKDDGRELIFFADTRDRRETP